VKSKDLKGKFNPPYFVDWSAKDDLRITEDFRKHRNYKKPEKRSVWVPFDKLKDFFESLTICRYQDDLNNVAKSFVVKGSGNFGCSIDNREQTTFFIEILQESKVFRPQDYSYSKVRIFVLKEKDYGIGIGKQHSLIKAAVNYKDQRSTFCELKLEPGKYKIVADVENPETTKIASILAQDADATISPEDRIQLNKTLKLPRTYDLVIHASRDLFKLIDLPEKAADSVVLETYSNLAIQRGTIESLNDDHSLRRYIFQSSKIGVCIFTYANRSDNAYSTVDKLEIKGEYSSSKNMESGKLRLNLPGKSKKFVVFRF